MSQLLTVSQLGEDALIERVASHFRPVQHLSVGIGDDGSVSTLPGATVLSTDMLVENYDFCPEWFDPYKLGIKAAAQNLADLYAMGATPHGLLMSLGVPGHMPVADVENLVRGLSAEAQRATPNCDVIGGDMSEAPVLTLSITAVGYLPTATKGSGHHTPLVRQGATKDSAIYLAGTLGRAAAGLDLLFAGLRLGDNRDVDDLINAQLAPQPDYHTAALLPGWAHAAIDASDGLVRDLGKVAKASGVGIDLDCTAMNALAEPLLPAAHALHERALTASPAAQSVPASGQSTSLHERALAWVLSGGEDHGFLIAGPATDAPVGLTRIGTCSATGPGQLRLGGAPLKSKAFTHFA